MRLPTLFLSFGVAIAGVLAGSPTQKGDPQVIVFAGTYTRDEGWINGTGKGVHTFKFDPTNGSLEPWATTSVGGNPIYVLGTRKPFSTGERVIYVVSAVAAKSIKYPKTLTGYVSALTLKRYGTLELLNTQETRGEAPTHISLSPKEDFIIVSNYEGSLTMFPLNDDGSLAPDSFHQEYTKGSGVVKERQSKAYIHSSVWIPDSNRVVAANLGSDELLVYEFDAHQQHFKSLKAINRPPGSGPRHMVLRDDMKFLYVVDELSNTVGVYAIDRTTGMLSTTAVQNITTLPAEFRNFSKSSDIHLSRDGNFLYTSNRGHDSIAIFKIDKEAGTLTSLGFESTLGNFPRGFTIYDKWLIVANQDSNNMHVFEVSSETGFLKYTGNSVEIGTAVCVYATEYFI